MFFYLFCSKKLSKPCLMTPVTRCCCFRGAVILFIFVTFLGSFLSPVLAVQQLENNVELELFENLGRVIKPVTDVVLQENILEDLDQVYLVLERDPNFMNCLDRILQTIRESGYDEQKIEQTIRVAVDEYLNSNPNFLLQAQDVAKKISLIMENYIETHPKFVEDTKTVVQNISKVRKITGSEKLFEKAGGYVHELMDIEGIRLNSDGFLKVVKGYFDKSLECAVKKIHRMNPYVRRDGVVSLAFSFIDSETTTAAVKGLTASLPNKGFLMVLLGKTIALTLDNQDDKQVFGPHLSSKLCGEFLRRCINESTWVRQYRHGQNSFDSIAFSREIVIGYIEFLVKQKLQKKTPVYAFEGQDVIVKDNCKVIGLFVEKLLEAFKDEHVSSKGITVGAVFESACLWRRHNVGLQMQLDNPQVPSGQHLCLSQLDESDTALTICDDGTRTARKVEDKDLRKDMLNVSDVLDFSYNANANDAVDKLLAVLSMFDRILFKAAAVDEVAKAKMNNAFTIVQDSTNVDGDAIHALKLVNNNDSPVIITRVVPSDGCGATVAFDGILNIMPRNVAELNLAGCQRGQSYILPIDYIVKDVSGNVRKDKYLHGLLCFMVPKERVTAMVLDVESDTGLKNRSLVGNRFTTSRIPVSLVGSTMH